MAKILAVDDQSDNLELLAQILEDGNHIALTACNGKKALVVAEQEMPDVILLDVQMPEMDGYEACNRLKENEKTKDIPIIFLTANTGEANIVKGLALGAYDYITKPFNEKELVARISVMVRIREAEKKVETMALTDTLTGLHNRRYLMQRFKEELSRAKHSKSSLSIIMFDIDFFKKVNDTHGHDFGDIVLQEVAKLLRDNVHDYDATVRFGGEEFVVLLPGTNINDAWTVADRIREEVELKKMIKDTVTVHVTISGGVFGTTGSEVLDDIETYIKRADEAMYVAKNGGRNQIVIYKKRNND